MVLVLRRRVFSVSYQLIISYTGTLSLIWNSDCRAEKRANEENNDDSTISFSRIVEGETRDT